MSYLDALRRATRTQEVPYEISDRKGSEFIETDIDSTVERIVDILKTEVKVF